MFGFGKRKQLEQKVAELTAQVASIQNTTILTADNYGDFFRSFTAASGMEVTPETAMRSSAVFACISRIAGAISVLPLPVYRRKGTEREKADHDVWWLLNEQPYQNITASSFWEWMIASKLLRDRGLAQIMRGRNGEVRGFMPLPRQCVVVEKKDGRFVYYVNDGISRYGLQQEDVIDLPGFCGMSVIAYAARNAIGTGLAADEFSGKFFANGASPSGVITYPVNVAPTKDQQDMLRAQFEERHTGVQNSHKPLLLVNGGNFVPVTMTAEDSQLLDTRKFQVIDIARAFGVPPHMIGETSASTSWGAGIEQMSIGFVRYTLGPHLTQIEQELNRKLWPRSTNYFLEFNRDGLLAGDSKSEAEYFGKSLGGPGTQGWMTINEVRRIKNLPPIPGGDKLIMAGAAPAQGTPNEEPDPAVSE